MMAAFQSPEQRQAYVDYLTSEGHFTPEEAQAQADKITSGSQQNKKSTSGGIMPPEPAEVQKLLNKSVEERAKQEGLTFTEKVGLGAGGAALLAGGGYLLGGGKPTTPSGGQGLKGRVFGPDVSATRIEPQMDVSRPTEPYFEGEKAPKPATAGTWEDLLSPEEKALIERSRANAPVREEYMKQIAPPVPTEPPAFIRNQPPASTAPAPELPAATNPRVPALLQPPAGAAVPSVALAPVPPTADKPAPPPPAPAPITPVAEPVKPTLPELLVAKEGETAMTVRGEKPVPMSALTTPEALQRAGTVLGGDTPEKIRYNLDLANQRGGLAPWEVHTILGNQGMPINEAPAVKATNDKVLEAIKSTAQTSLGKPDLVTGTGMPAYQGQGDEGSKLAHKKGVFESVKQIPKEYVFVPTGQNMDIVRNAVGQPEYTKNLKSSGGYPASPQTAYEQSRNINKSLGRATMAEAKASGVALPEPTPSITQKIAGSKTVRVAGVTGALILATDLASAATTGESPLANMAQGFKEAVKNKDYKMAASQAAELLNFHPYTLLANQLFGTSPEELQILRQADQARKAKAGNAATSRK